MEYWNGLNYMDNYSLISLTCSYLALVLVQPPSSEVKGHMQTIYNFKKVAMADSRRA